MGIILGDGEGTGNTVGVNDNNRLKVQAITETESEAQSKEGLTYSWSGQYLATSAALQVMSLKNTSTSKDLHITSITLASLIATSWELFEVTSGTAAGTGVTGQNLNLGSGKTADATAFGDGVVTGSLTGNTLFRISTPITDSKHIPLEGAIILTKDNEIALTATIQTTTYVTILGHYE